MSNNNHNGNADNINQIKESHNYSVENKHYVVNSFIYADDNNKLKNTLINLITNDINNNL